MNLLFAIRDDDICYHTDPDILENIYSEISEICPINFSCIPFIGGFDLDNFSHDDFNLYEKHWRNWLTKRIYPIGDNKRLVNFIRDWCKLGKASVMLHGINHNINEMTQNKNFENIIYEAKKYLEKIFDMDIQVASPPNNSLGVKAVRGLYKNNFNILTSFGHYPNERPLSIYNFYNFLCLLKLYFTKGKKFRLLKPLNFGTHYEQPCYGLGPNTSFDDLLNGLHYSIKNGGNFVVATHYYHLYQNKSLLNDLKKLIDFAVKQNTGIIQFVKANKLFKELK